jgi:MoaA/NifB/PqqE/SkfB family radical SAM enzyme
MKFDIDPEFSNHFRNVKQVFLYINDECNIHCVQCIYKPNVTYNEGRQIPLDTAIDLVSDFHELGARKLTILGGEPTLYGASENNQPLFDFIAATKRIGFDYVRMDTNGQFPARLLDSGLQQLDEIAFSLDGFSPEINDPVRGTNTFRNCVRNIKKAVQLGYRVTITCCIHRKLVEIDCEGNYAIEAMIRLAEQLGVANINFHDLFKAGVPMDTWTGDLNTSVEEHVQMYNHVRPKIDAGHYKVAVRLPQCFIRREEFQRNPEYFGYCPVKMGERIMVHSNGVLRICSNLICSAFGVGRYFDKKIWWDKSGTNEVRHHQLSELTPCTNRSKNKTYGDYVPLCFSFKPDQDEFVWKEMLHWDQRRVAPVESAL